jgi:hypothetical protein
VTKLKRHLLGSNNHGMCKRKKAEEMHYSKL